MRWSWLLGRRSQVRDGGRGEGRGACGDAQVVQRSMPLCLTTIYFPSSDEEAFSPACLSASVSETEVVPQGPGPDDVDVPHETVPPYRFPADSAQLLQHHHAAGHPFPPGAVRDDARRLLASQMLRDRLAQEGKAKTEAGAEAEAGRQGGGRGGGPHRPSSSSSCRARALLGSALTGLRSSSSCTGRCR